jgi:hypothetical protein
MGFTFIQCRILAGSREGAKPQRRGRRSPARRWSWMRLDHRARAVPRSAPGLLRKFFPSG